MNVRNHMRHIEDLFVTEEYLKSNYFVFDGEKSCSPQRVMLIYVWNI